MNWAMGAPVMRKRGLGDRDQVGNNYDCLRKVRFGRGSAFWARVTSCAGAAYLGASE
jgi:hypothetical protein